jgi:para-nitrobenzyl esterase
MRIPSFEQAARKSALHAAPTYAYVYSWRTPVLDDRVGTFHACEISYVFDNGELCDHYSAGSVSGLRLSRQMGRAWTNFARTGNPNHDDLPYWPTYSVAERSVMYLDSPCYVRSDPEGSGLKLIAGEVSNFDGLITAQASCFRYDFDGVLHENFDGSRQPFWPLSGAL